MFSFINHATDLEELLPCDCPSGTKSVELAVQVVGRRVCGQRTLLKASLDGVEESLGGHPTALRVAVLRENLPKVADLLLSERTCSHY